MPVRSMQSPDRAEVNGIVKVSGRIHFARVRTHHGHWRATLICCAMQVPGYRAHPVLRGAVGFVDCEACRARVERHRVTVSKT